MVALEGWSAGGLRQLEPELPRVLKHEPMPRTNVVLFTAHEPPPKRLVEPPGPFTDEQLLPAGVREEVVAFGKAVIQSIQRARRGGEAAWCEAKRIRPESRTFTEKEALNACARGYQWRKHADGLWHVVQPSRHPDDPPNTGVNGAHFEELAEREHLVDYQLRSWMLHGTPGAAKLKVKAQLAATHVGALKHAEQFVEASAKGVSKGFCSTGFEFPEIWPCIVDPLNIVVQHSKPRITIDKSMLVSGDEDLPSYNLTIELERDELGKRYKLAKVWELGRAAAILETAVPVALKPKSLAVVVFAKLDLGSFFNIHGKQSAYLWQSARLTLTGFGTSFRNDFGERDAPDHMGRSSNAICYFARRELLRLQQAYPSVVPEVIAWLALRRRCREEAAVQAEDSLIDFVWEVLFFLMYYVDDGGLALIDEPLHDERGKPVIELVTAKDGSLIRRHRRRGALFFEAIVGVIEYVGHTAPEDKRAYPVLADGSLRRSMVLLGIGLDLDRSIRFLDSEKATRYHTHLVEVESSSPLENGALRVPYGLFNSLVHRLLHASEVKPLGRSHCFYLLRALHGLNRLEVKSVLVGAKAQQELRWWHAALLEESEHSVPMASRRDFPGSDEPGVLTDYGDASREYDEETGLADPSSGFGAWTVIDDVFYYIEGRWSHAECAAFSINVLEFATECFSTSSFLRVAESLAVPVTHVHTFIDNTCAESVSERGRTDSAAINELNQQRHELLVSRGVHQRASRVPSVFNDVADLLSRGDIEEALRFPRENGLEVRRVTMLPEERDLSHLAPTWSPNALLARRLASA